MVKELLLGLSMGIISLPAGAQVSNPSNFLLPLQLKQGNDLNNLPPLLLMERNDLSNLPPLLLTERNDLSNLPPLLLTERNDLSNLPPLLLKGGIKGGLIEFDNYLSVPNQRNIKRNPQSGPEFLKSLLIPGWGQLSVGRKKTGYAFLATEAALIATLIGLRTYAGWLEDDYRIYAAQHARARSDLDHQFYVDIGNWRDRRSYNEQRQRERDYDRLYWGPDTDWSWDTESHRESFKSTRLASDNARQQAVLVVGGILLNHLASAIEAGRGSKSKAHLSVIPQGRAGVGVNMSWNLLF